MRPDARVAGSNTRLPTTSGPPASSLHTCDAAGTLHQHNAPPHRHERPLHAPPNARHRRQRIVPDRLAQRQYRRSEAPLTAPSPVTPSGFDSNDAATAASGTRRGEHQ
ncbi:hypothetical protein DQ04_16681000 [Trypanosoma grayi]|uniref:hypothetical protein n=1 Tax=Trypanosoma grayi TaxID=71804 RepID=UPI0004F45403|nr:hypothetical protein DQ04_16681000 [Trypanosoma grayi]KEG06000.1 hypothetical protein DQ04_16681000 [Trypanosoma grayi]